MTPLDDLGRRLQEAIRGPFRVDRQIGKGGMATVYAGEDESLERPVAIKVLSGARLAEPGMLERFEREAKTVALLDHPNIVRIYTTEHADDLHAIVMEFIEGSTLDEYMEESGGVSVSRVLEWFAELASALDYAHSRGVIHRDLKSSNVMVRPDGSVVLTDFGIARFGEGDGLTRTGQVIGTPTYLSPEQWKDEELTAAADQYSCGVLLYELLAGAPPFTGPPIQVWLAHIERAPPPLLEARPDLPPAVAAAVHRMLSKKPEERFPDMASAVRAARGKYAPGDAPPPAEPVEPAELARRLDARRVPERRSVRSAWRKWKLPLAGIGGLSVVATVGFAMYLGPGPLGAGDPSGEEVLEDPPSSAAELPSRVVMPPLRPDADPQAGSQDGPEESGSPVNPPAVAGLDGTAWIGEPRIGGSRELSVHMSFAGLGEGEALCVVPLYEVGGASASPGPPVDASISGGSGAFRVAADVVAPLAGLSVTELGGRLQVWRGPCGSRAGTDPDRTLPIEPACVRRFPSGQWHPCDRD